MATGVTLNGLPYPLDTDEANLGADLRDFAIALDSKLGDPIFKGEQGIQGIQGIQGDKGDTGFSAPWWTGTQVQYNALGTWDANKLYVIVG